MNNITDLQEFYKGVSLGAYSVREVVGPVVLKHDFSEEALWLPFRDIAPALLYDCDRLLKAALNCYLGHNFIAQGGYYTWSDIILYYCRFHTITALLRLVGTTSLFIEKPKSRNLLLLRQEGSKDFLLVTPKHPIAKELGFGRGGSHGSLWKMFFRCFSCWDDPDFPFDWQIRAAEKDPEEWAVKFDSLMRNQANYLQRIPGMFFSETDMTGMQAKFVGLAKKRGHWNPLDDDITKIGYSIEDDPDAEFTEERQTWSGLKYSIKAFLLVGVGGSSELRDTLLAERDTLLAEYVWIIESVIANEELKSQMISEISQPLGD